MLSQTVQTWLELTSAAAHRRFLEAHAAWLSPEGEALLVKRLGQAVDVQRAANLRTALALVQDTNLRGGTPEAIGDAAINVLGGFALDLPPWLVEVEGCLAQLAQRAHPRQAASERVSLLRKALTRAQGEPGRLPPVQATLQQELLAALLDVPPTDSTRGWRTSCCSGRSYLKRSVSLYESPAHQHRAG
jgi:hypothetical protein